MDGSGMPENSERTFLERITSDEGFIRFCKVYSDCLLRYKGAMMGYLGTQFSIPSDTLLGIYSDCYSAAGNPNRLLDYIYSMTPNEDELTYSQSFGAALLAGAFADWLGYPEEKKRKLILCGFYYDIGKWKLPSDILWKPGKLSDEEFALVRQHTLIGYKLVKDDTALSEDIKKCILMHHEKIDGSGYPLKLTGDKINEYARFLSIVDTYIAMASPRAFREAFTPLQIIGAFERDIDKYDTKILVPLIEKIAEAQIGTTVELNDGSRCEVVFINKNPYSRPMVKNKDNVVIDLKDNSTLQIVRMI